MFKQLFITPFCLCLLLAQYSCVNHNRSQQTTNIDSTIDQVTRVVGSLRIVKEEIKLVDSLSSSKRHISLMPRLEDSLRNIYLVKVAEDNGTSYVTYYNFLVDGKTMKIINPSGKIEGQD